MTGKGRKGRKGEYEGRLEIEREREKEREGGGRDYERVGREGEEGKE